MKDNGTDDLLRFKSSVNLGRTTIAANKTLVDGGASTNFMSEDTYRKILESGGRYSISEAGWMKVTAAGWESPRERRRRVTVRVEIGPTYSKEIQFTVFSGLGSAGYDMVLGKPWLRLHNRAHDIDYVTNEMWIDERSDLTGNVVRHHLVGLRPELEERTERARALGLHTVTWREVCNERHRDKGVKFFLARPNEIRRQDRYESADGVDQALLNTVTLAEISEIPGLEAEMRKRFPKIFEPPTGVPPRRPFDLKIELKPGAKAPHFNPYRVTPLEDAEMRRQLETLQDDGWIQDSSSPFAAPILFVRKSGSDKLRLCVDYRALNSITQRDRYPLPHMDDLLNDVHGSSFFTKLDLKAGYHQMRLREGDREKTAFITKYGLYEWTVVPFGLANAPSAFMRTMSKLLQRHRKYCVVYLDDILIHTKGTEATHIDKVKAVLETINGDGWKVAPEKCV